MEKRQETVGFAVTAHLDTVKREPNPRANKANTRRGVIDLV